MSAAIYKVNQLKQKDIRMTKNVKTTRKGDDIVAPKATKTRAKKPAAAKKTAELKEDAKKIVEDVTDKVETEVAEVLVDKFGIDVEPDDKVVKIVVYSLLVVLAVGLVGFLTLV